MFGCVFGMCIDYFGDEGFVCEVVFDVVFCEYIFWLVEFGFGGVEVGVVCGWVSLLCWMYGMY